MTKHESPADLARPSVEIPLANAVASLLTPELSHALKMLPTGRDALGRFHGLTMSAQYPLYPSLSGLTANGLVVKQGNTFRLSIAGSLVREALEEFGPGENLEAATILVDRSLPNLNAEARERAILMAEALIATAGPDVAMRLVADGV